MDARARIGGARPARDHANAGLASELAIGLGHHRGPALLAAGDERHTLAQVIERVDHRKVALARNAENKPGAVQGELIGENSASGSFGRFGHASSLCFSDCADVSARGSPLTPALSRQARLGVLATQRNRIRKRVRMGRGSPGVPAEKAYPLPSRERVAAKRPGEGASLTETPPQSAMLLEL